MPTKKSVPIVQKVRWQAAREGKETGMIVESEKEVDFIPWEKLKPELEAELIVQLGRVLGDKVCTVETSDWNGRKDWIINIVDENKEILGSIWLGGDPLAGWKWDGKVRAGRADTDNEATVWQIFERYSDGSYRRVEAFA